MLAWLLIAYSCTSDLIKMSTKSENFDWLFLLILRIKMGERDLLPVLCFLISSCVPDVNRLQKKLKDYKIFLTCVLQNISIQCQRQADVFSYFL